MIRVPTLFLDVKRCKKNIEKMAAKAKRHGIEFRPHAKTHQSLEISKWFKEVGVTKLTVSSLKMAEYFSEEWIDITVAFPTNILEIQTINKLAKKIQLNLCVENIEVLEFLNDHLEHPLGIFLKIDTGYNRTGIAVDNYKLINTLLLKMSEQKFLTL